MQERSFSQDIHSIGYLVVFAFIFNYLVPGGFIVGMGLLAFALFLTYRAEGREYKRALPKLAAA